MVSLVVQAVGGAKAATAAENHTDPNPVRVALEVSDVTLTVTHHDHAYRVDTSCWAVLLSRWVSSVALSTHGKQ